MPKQLQWQCNALTHLSLVSFLWDIGKQLKNRLECGVWSGFALFAHKMYFWNLMKLKFTTQQPLNRKWIRPNDKDGIFH